MSEEILYVLRPPSEVKIRLRTIRLEEFPEIKIGYRPCWNLVKLAKKENTPLRVPSHGDFYLQEIFCSFDPTRNEKIDEAESEIIVEEPSIVYDMAPRKLIDAIEHENEFGISTELNIGLVKVDSKYVRKQKSKSVVPNLYTFGIGSSRAKWTFSRGKQETLFGTQGLALIIMTPKGKSASMILELSAISTKGWLFGTKEIPSDKKCISVGPHRTC